MSNPAACSSSTLCAAPGWGLHELVAPTGLRLTVLPNGAPHAFRHGETLLNQFLPGPAEDGLFRLLLRQLDADAMPVVCTPLVGADVAGESAHDCHRWHARDFAGACTAVTTLRVHPTLPGWSWHVRIHNSGTVPLRCDVMHAQDLGLADTVAVRNNEAYVSQYLDLLPVTDPALGPVILARQNQPQAGGRHPWLATACATGAVAYCTDGRQFFGADYRLTGRPLAAVAAALPSRRLQGEFAVAGLQSRIHELAPGAFADVVMVARYVPDHPAASSLADLALLHALLPLTPSGVAPHPLAASVFTATDWVHGETATAADLAAWFPGSHRHEEREESGPLFSFFTGSDTHVVLRAKEAVVDRPHGHILRSGEVRWIDGAQFGVTCYAAGVFGAQAYLGNPSLARLLTVLRNPLNLTRATGQRVLARCDGTWRQLGVPSAWAVRPGEVRWIYRIGGRVITARVWCSAGLAASYLELRVSSGEPLEFLVTHQLALGPNEFDDDGQRRDHGVGGIPWLELQPAVDGVLARYEPDLRFAIAAGRDGECAALGGDELIHLDGQSRSGPYVALRSTLGAACTVIMAGARSERALAEIVAAARAELAHGEVEATPPRPPVRLRGSADAAAVSRIDEVLPWFTHNAAIHFSAPHGLEQYGGGAWGVRDVTQGSIEWLLAAGRHDIVRRVLTTVFAQHYADEGGWPQWFMHPPYQSIQQNHCHGDVCLWPVKALCDYVEAANDFDFLQVPVGYTDPATFAADERVESLWHHCDRVIALVESRFLPGTALLNYGDGDWDDTLQPADPSLRTRMVSAWTVALAYHTFGQLAAVARRADEGVRAARLEGLLARMRGDFVAKLMPDGVTAGFLVQEPDGSDRPLLHPSDRVTGIRYRLLPMTRAVLAGLFSPEEAARHLEIVERELRCSDGVRLMSEPAIYRGGVETLFKRAETAANVGREIGLQYVHAHLRYAEAMARMGHANRLWWALQVVNPVDLAALVPNAAARQSNVYFSSSDADFADRVEAAARWPEVRTGEVSVRGGWRLYSSGPGIYVRLVRACLLGVRESFGTVIFDPVLPRELDGLEAEVEILGRAVTLGFRVGEGTSGPRRLLVNGHAPIERDREANPYRAGGRVVDVTELARLLTTDTNRIEIEL